MLICPVCKQQLNTDARAYKCENGHCFDMAKEGYVNLLLGSKSGDRSGDSKESARARRALLEKGYYSCLKEYISSLLHGTVLDICCGEGYYDDYDGTLYGFDLSKEMVRLASKSHDNCYFVANLADIPIKDESIDTAIHLFAPFNDKEFARVLKKDGVLYSVIPGRRHLFEMKQIIYDNPYENDEEAPESTCLTLASRTRITDKITISEADLKLLFSMTPYYFRTSEANKARLDGIDYTELTVDFIVLEYRR